MRFGNINTHEMIHVIAVAYNRLVPLRILIDSFLVQTDNRWKLNIIYDGLPPQEIMELIRSYTQPFYSRNANIDFEWTNKRNGNYGHPNRRMMLDKLVGEPGDFVLMTNDDNYYVPTFVAQMMEHTKDNNCGIVYCDTVHSHFGHSLHSSSLVEYGIDMGAFIVRYNIAKAVRFIHEDFSADGKYAQECSRYCGMNGLIVTHIQRPLFIHN